MLAGQLLMGAELALSIVLLSGGALLMKSLWRLESVAPGFRHDHLLTMQVSLPRSKYPGPGSVRDFYREVVQRLEVLPGVRSAAAVNIRPFLNFSVGTMIEVPGRPAPRAGEPPLVIEHRVATPGYLRTMGIPLLAGRDLAEGDGPDSAGVVVVNQLAARQLWPNENPIGKQIRPWFPKLPSPWQPDADPMGRWLTVVGVASNVKENALNDPERPKIYFSAQQFPSAFMFLAVRTEVPPESLWGAIRKEVLAVDRDQPMSDVRTMDSAIRESTTQPRLSADLLVWFVAIAVLLSAAGVYGVMSYVTGRRAHEIAIRMAVGARPADVLVMVFREIGWIGLAAAGAGSIASAWMTGALKSLLFEVAPTDPLVFTGAAISMFGVALAACIVPARKAARVDPVTALRSAG
jgi:putative ABC transport system permease protein